MNHLLKGLPISRGCSSKQRGCFYLSVFRRWTESRRVAVARNRMRTGKGPSLSCSRQVHRLWRISVGGLAGILAICASAMSEGNQEDLLLLLKRSVNTPPDVEHFVASQEDLRTGNVPPEVEAELRKRGITTKNWLRSSFLEGAFAGTNFFVIARTNAEGALNAGGMGQPVWGRSGTNTYEIGIRSSTHSFESVDRHPENPVSQWGVAQHGWISQLLRFGVGGPKAGSVTWNDLAFTAQSETNVTIIGRLELSNNLPQALSLGIKGREDYALITYEYPDPVWLFDGYPKQMKKYEKVGDQWQPASQFTIYTLRLVGEPLPADFFSDAKFLTTNQVSKIFASNGAFFASRGGKVTKMGSFKQLESPPRRRSKTKTVWILRGILAFSGLILVVVVFGVVQKSRCHPRE